MFIATDDGSFEIGKCSNCGEIYPICVHGCPECGCTTVILLREDKEDERAECGNETRQTLQRKPA